MLVAGLWLPTSIWEDVADALRARGHRVHAVQLPGVDDDSPTATLEDQLEAVLSGVDAADRPLVVGHSAASTLAWMVADRRPDEIAGVVLIGGFPNASGSAYADFFPAVDGRMAFPGWGPFAGPDSDDLDVSARSHLEALTIPVPESVSTATVELHDERRFTVPLILVCPEFSPEQARAWIDDEQIPELGRAQHLTMVDIDSGHWPMVTRPVELARILDAAARTTITGG